MSSRDDDTDAKLAAGRKAVDELVDRLSPFMEQFNRAEEERARQLAPMIAAVNRAAEQHEQEMAPVMAALKRAEDYAAERFGPLVAALQRATGSSLIPARDWEKPAAAAVEKIKSGAAGGAEPAKAELALELARGVADATGRLIASSTENRIALEAAIGNLVKSSDNNTKTMSRLTRQLVGLTLAYVALTLVITVATVVGVYLAWHPAPPHVDVHVPTPVVNVHPVILAPPPAPTAKPTATPRAARP